MDVFKEITKKHILSNPIRLGIMIYLLPRRKALFKELLAILEITPGNLDSNLRVLYENGYVHIRKVFADRPRTMVIITERGIDETKKYMKKLKELLSSISNTPELIS